MNHSPNCLFDHHATEIPLLQRGVHTLPHTMVHIVATRSDDPNRRYDYSFFGDTISFKSHDYE